MKLAAESKPDSLASLGTDAVEMLCRGDIEALALRYGYALALGRDTATAIRDDVGKCLSEVGATALAPAPRNPVRSVKYFEPNTTNLLAVVECLAPTDGQAPLLVELVVSRSGTEEFITLEQISAVA